jgi:hypothetical protein
MGVFIVIGGPGGILVSAEQLDLLLPFVALALTIGPGVIGILLTGLVGGRVGLRDLLARLRRGWVDARWYAVALLNPPLLATATLFACPHLPSISAWHLRV